MTELIIKMEHVRKAKMCAWGTKKFFSKHNLDWKTFLVEGLPSSVIEATGDAMALKVVEIARGRG